MASHHLFECTPHSYCGLEEPRDLASVCMASVICCAVSLHFLQPSWTTWRGVSGPHASSLIHLRASASSNAYGVHLPQIYMACSSICSILCSDLFFQKIFMCDCAGSSLLGRLFSSCSERGLLFVAVHRLLIALASLVAELNSGGWTQQSQFPGSVVVVHGLSCSMAFGIFPDQGSNPCLLNWLVVSLPLSLQGSPVHRS